MWKGALTFVLVVAFVIELALAMGAFFAPSLVLEAFKVPVSSDTLFLGHVIAWLLLVITLVCGLTVRWVHSGNAAGWSLSYLLGGWWVAIGLGLFLGFGLVDNLLLDSLKGAIILVTAIKSRNLSSRENI